MGTSMTVIVLLLVLIVGIGSSPTQLVSGELSEASLATLEYVAVITRHGSRTPLRTYPNDPYPYNNNLFWPTGPGELTYFGKKQLYNTGEKLRERYDGFLPVTFYPNDTLAEYNNLNRDFMSTSCLLAALYPPVGREIWNPNLMWQPIPLHVRSFDVCGLAYGTKCPAFKADADQLLKTLSQKYMTNTETSELMKQISLHTGSNITTVSELFDIYDSLNMQHQNGFKLPGWAKELYPEPLRSKATPQLLTMYGGSTNIIKLGAGPELKRISNMLNMKANGTYEENRKLYVEAAHDCTLIALLRSLGYNDPSLEVRTSAYMIFELHYLPEIYIVQVLFYKDTTVEVPEFVNIADCPSPCSLEEFTNFVDKINPPDWNKACQTKSQTSKSFWQRV